MEDSIELVRQGKAWAAIHLAENFTMALLKRVCSMYPSTCPTGFGSVTNQVINESSIHVHADVSSM